MPRTPIEDGFSMPAEWEPHAGTFISWPCKESTWQGNFKAVKKSFAEIIEALSCYEPITVLATPSTTEEARGALGRDIEIFEVELNDSWIRDNGPIFLRDSEGHVTAADFKFNSWGGKYPPYDKDDLVPVKLAEHFGMRRYDAPMVLEGGSISVDGEGTLLTTSQCLLNPNRNPELSQIQIEQVLNNYLGVRKVLWLGQGITGDLTDGHVDGVACFTSPRTVMIANTENQADPNYDALQDNLKRLQSATDAKGRSIEIIKLIQPPPMDVMGITITPDYPNHYIINDAVIVPTYGIPEDTIAMETIEAAYPGREVVGVFGGYLEIGGGGIHCITQQRPTGIPLL